MKDQKLVTKAEFAELAKNNGIDNEFIDRFNLLPENFINDKIEYEINNMVYYENDKLISVSLNYYCKKLYKFLFPYTIEMNIEFAILKLDKNFYFLNK